MGAHRPKYIYQAFSPAYRRVFGIAATALGLIIIFHSLTVSNAQGGIPYLDKAAHAVAYFLLGFLTLPALSRLQSIFVWAGLSLFGGALELAQGVMSLGRKADFFDALANSAGALAALLVWLLITSLVHLNASPARNP